MNLEEFQNGYLFNVNKPVGWSSFAVVNKIKYILKHHFNIKKIKVGHAGTLDPFATGVLLVCIGKKTKEISQFVDMKKEYIATFKLGAISDTYDVTGNVIVNNIDSLPDLDTIKKTIQQNFSGEIAQIPPMFSAKKIDGQRLYKLARKGVEVERKPSFIHIFDYQILDFCDDKLKVKIQCSKGTYIRSLAHDLGQKLGCGAYCEVLERSAIGDYTVESSKSIEEIEAFICNSF